MEEGGRGERAGGEGDGAGMRGKGVPCSPVSAPAAHCQAPEIAPFPSHHFERLDHVVAVVLVHFIRCESLDKVMGGGGRGEGGIIVHRKGL